MMGLTEKMKVCHAAVIEFVALHGATPSVQSVADQLGCAKSQANLTLNRLIERGHLSRAADGSLALGGAGVLVAIAPDLAAKLAAFCMREGESLTAVLSDAILLHLDSVAGSEQ